MELRNRNEIVKYGLLVLFVLASRLPFIFAGYGIDGDSWSVAITARHLHDTGEYTASRLPGYPVHEVLASFFIEWGPAGLNMLSALFSAMGVLFFALTLRQLRFKQIFLASIALSMVPVLYIQSTTAIDYVIALAFILGGLYFLLTNKIIAAGVFVGLAIGTRITSGAMLIPFSILLLDNKDLKVNLRKIAVLFTAGILTGALLFLPVFMTYGISFFTYYNVPYPSVAKVLYKFFIETWGVIGFIGLVISTGLLFLPNRITERKFLFPRAVNEKYVISWLVAIDLYIIAFLKLPMESGYLIPIIPFVILIFGKYLYDTAFVFLCAMLIVSPLVCTISPRERFDAVTPSAVSFDFRMAGENLYFDVLKGPVLSYESRRKNGVEFTDKLLSSFDTMQEKSVVVAGKWYNQLTVRCKDVSKLKTTLHDYLSEEEAVFYYAKGYRIYYLPKQDYYNKIMRNTDLEIYKAQSYIHDIKY